MTQQDNESRKWLYDKFVNSGLNVGKDYAEFSALMDSNEESRQWAFDKARSMGLNVGADYNQFSSLISPVQQEEQEQTQEPVTEQPVKPIENTVQNVAEPTIQTGIKPLQGHEVSRIEDAPGYVEPKSDELQAKEQNRQQVMSLSEEIDNAILEQQNRNVEQFKKEQSESPLAMALAYMAPNATPHLHNRIYQGHSGQEIEYRTLQSAQRSLRDAQRMIDEADHNAQQGTFGKWLESSFAGGAARGLGQKLFDADTWDMGVSDMDDASSLMTALNTFDSGKPLTKNQQLLLDAKAVELATNAYFGSEVGRGYKAGAVTAESIPFMIEMCINPASATGEGATSMLTRYALKRFGKNAVKNNAKKYLAAKATAQVVGDLAGSAAMAATTGAGRVIGGTAERMNGDIQIDNDENGNTIFAGHGDGEDFGSAFYKSFASTTIENYSEMFGEYFEPVLSPIGGAMSRIATSKGGKKIGLNYVKDFIDNVAASDVAKIVTDFEKHAKWNGMFGEYAEEVAGGIMNALVVGDQTLDTDEDSGVFNLDQNIDTFLGVSLMGGFMSGVKTLGYRTPKYKARKAMEKADNTASLKFNSPEDWQFIRESIVSGTDEDTEVMLYNVLKNDDFSAEQKMAVLDFTRRYEEYCGVVQGEDSERGEKVQKIADEQATEEEEQQLAVSRAYDHGHEAPTEERRDIIFDAQFNPDNAEAQQSYQGMLDRINEDADQWRDSQIELAQFMSSTDETLRPAQLKAVDEEGKDQFVFIREGKVSLTEDGTMIDVANSDKTIVVYNQKTGKREMISPKDLLSLGNEESLDAAIDDIAQRRDHMVQQEINQANGILSFIPGDVVSIKTEDGQLAQGTLISTDGTNSVIQLEDGSQVGASNAELQQLADDLALADYKQRKGIADEAPTEQPAAEQLNEKPNGAPAEYTNDMELVVRDENGQDKRAIVQGRVRYDAQTLSFIPDENGAMIEYYVEGEGMKHDYPDRLNDKVVSYTSVEKPATEPQGTVAEPEAGVTEADNTSVEEKPVVNNEVEDTPNSYVGRSLSEKEADDIVSKMEAAADAAPDIPLNETTWNEQFPNGEVETPIGMAKFGENQLAKLFLKGREKEFGMLKPTLTNPDVIIEEESQAIDGNAERNSSYLFVKTFNYGGEKVKFYTSVTVKKDGMEVVISNHITGRNAINKKMQNGKILHLNENYAPSSSDLHLAENQNGLPDLLPTQEAKPLLDATLSSPDINEGSRSVAPNSGISGGKVTENSATIQEKAEENVGNMPMTEDGEPDYMSVTPERAHSFIYNEAGLSRDEANEHVKANLDKAQDDFQKAKNAATPKKGTSIKKFNEQKEKRQQKIDDAQRRVDYWAKVSKQQSDIIAAKRAEQQAKDAAAHDAAVEANLAEREEQKRKDAERQAVGNQNVMPEIRDKWEKATKIDGEADEIMLPNGTSVSGHYVLHESGAATASHQATAGFAPTDGYPLDENGNNANTRDYEHNKNDQDYTRQIAGSYNQMALDKPVVVSRDGVVLSGNGRTMAGELAAQDGTDQAYIDYLKKYGYKKYGFSPEQIAAMEHPRVAFVPDADMPYNSETFDMFNKSDMKENSKTEESVKLGKTVSDDVYQKLIRLVGESGSTLGEFYNNDQATSEAVSLLVSSGIIGSNEAPKYASEGKLSEVGRDLIENILVGKAFSNNPDAVRMLTAVPSLRKSAVSALSEITTNMGMNEDFNLQQPLSDAINLAYKARTEGGYGFGDPVSGYARQLNLFAFEDEMQTEADVNNATTLLLADLLNSGRESDLKKFMRSYNEQSKESADGQIDMWTGDVKHRDEIIKELFDQLKYKQNNDRKQKPTAVEPRAKQRKGVEQTGESMPSVQDDTTVEQQNNNPAENIPDSGNKDVENIPNDEDPWGIADRIEEQEDDWEEDGNLNTVYKRTVLIDGKHKVTKIDAPYDNKNNYQTSYEYDGKSFADLKQVVDYIDKPSVQQTVASAEAEVNTEPTEAQKKAGNYKKGHAKVAGFDITIENPKGSQRSGVDENGNAWSNTMNNTYGYIRGTEGVDGDHIDVFLADDMGTWDGKTVFIVDQKKRSGKTFSKLEGIDGNEIDLGYEEPVMVFDEHKVMLGFNDIESALDAYLSNYEEGWFAEQDGVDITACSLEDFKKWISSSHRKTKPFSEYTSIKSAEKTTQLTPLTEGYTIEKKSKVNKKGEEGICVNFTERVSKDEFKGQSEIAKRFGGYYSRGKGFVFKTKEAAQDFAETIMGRTVEEVENEAPVTINDISSANGGENQTKVDDKPMPAEKVVEKLVDKLSQDKEVKTVLGAGNNNEALLAWMKERINNEIFDGFDNMTMWEAWQTNADKIVGAVHKKLSKQFEEHSEDNSSPVQQVDVEGLFGALAQNGEAKLSDHAKSVDEGKQKEIPTESHGTDETGSQQEQPKSKWVNDEDAARFEELKARMRAKLGQLNMNIDPEIFMIGTEMGFLMLKKGARRLKEFAEALIEICGDGIRPYITSIYDGARRLSSKEVQDEMSSHDEVDNFDAFNFDKSGAKDIVATAEHKTREIEAQKVAAETEQQLKDKRNEYKRNEEKQVAAATEAVVNEAETVASEVEGKLEATDTEQGANELAQLIDEQLDKVNEQLALLGYYEAEENDKDFNEAYGYMRNAEKKAVKDIKDLFDRLCEDLHLKLSDFELKDSKGKKRKLINANIAPAGGDITMRLPLGMGVEMYFDFGMTPDYSDNLSVTHIMYRTESRQSATSQNTLYGSNHYIEPNATYKDFLGAVKTLAKQYLPQEDYVAMAQRIAEENPQPKGKGILGNIYDQFKGKAKEAVAFLIKRKEGVAEAALHHDEVGDIDLAWGDEKSGLAHIIEKHPEITDNLQGLLDGMHIVEQSDNRIVLESGTHKAIISKMKGDQATPNWLLTAYEKKKSVSASSSDIETEPEGKQNGTATLQSGLSGGKDTNKNRDTQGKGEKSGESAPNNGADEAARSDYESRLANLTDKELEREEAASRSDLKVKGLPGSAKETMRKDLELIKAEKERRGKKIEESGDDDLRFRFIGEKGAANADAAEGGTNRMDNLRVAEEMEKRLSNEVARKKERIEKLRGSEAVSVKYEGQYELNRDSAKQWMKDNLRGVYTNADTGERIEVGRIGIKEVTSHGAFDEAHLKSLSAIPQMIEGAVFIDELPNTKGTDKFNSYRYYVCGLEIDGEPYTAKIVVGVKDGKRYYDHRLTQIEKGTLLDNLSGLSNTAADKQNSLVSVGKDTKLLSILQANEGEIAKKIKLATGWERGKDGKWRYEEPDGFAITDKEREELAELNGSYGVNIKKIFPDEDIYAAYPELAKTMISVKDMPNDTAATYRPAHFVFPPFIDINKKHLDHKGYTNDNLRGTLIHEIQHAIQHAEGFANGGSPLTALINMPDAKRFKLEVEETYKAAQEKGYDISREDIEKMFSDDEKLAEQTEAEVLARTGLTEEELGDIYRTGESVAYNRLAGEVEARNAARRRDMTDEERRNTLASETEDVSRGEQIIRYDDVMSSSEVVTPEQADELENGGTVKAYRAMQVIDGKLYPPMAAVVDGELAEPAKFGRWMQSEEHPELIDPETGTFKLNKGQGKGTVPAAYNPYFHTSLSPLNDQFSSAYVRPNLVIVEVDVPKSELTSGYKAPFAKDAVGEMGWHSGSVSGALAAAGKPRRVMLSRYCKVSRILTNEEVGKEVAKLLQGTDIAIPYNVVTPQLAEELKKHGIKISEDASGTVGEDKGYGKAEYITDEQIAAINGQMNANATNSAEAKKEHATSLATRFGVQPTIVENVEDIKNLPSFKKANKETQQRMLRSKGWFDNSTGEIVVVTPNNIDVEDVAATIFHETVAHKGLRELVGEENYGDFLREVYEHLNAKTREKVTKRAMKNGWNYEKAMDEYFGELSEKSPEEFDKEDRSIWQVIKQKVLDAINKFLKSLKLPKWIKLGDNELRYMLWRSAENLKRGKESLVQKAQDIVKRNDLKVGEDVVFKMGDAASTFVERQKQAEVNRGTVLSGLNEAEVKVVAAEPHSFKSFVEAEQWADDNIVRTYSNEETGGKGEVRISKAAIKKYLSESAVSKSASKDVHLSVLKMIPDVIRESIEAEEHADYSKNSGVRNSVNAVNKDVLVHRLYSAVSMDGNLYRVKITMKEYLDANKPSKPHSYEATKIELLDTPLAEPYEGQSQHVEMMPNSSNSENEVLAGTLEGTDSIFPNASTSNGVSNVSNVFVTVAKLLKDVEKSYDSGKKLLDESKKTDVQGSIATSSDILSDISFREQGETEDIWADQSLGFSERLTAAAIRLSDNHNEDKRLRNDAMQAISSNLQEIRQAMSLQRRYDRTTVKRISDLARILMSKGFINDPNQQEVKRLLSVITKSAGVENIDTMVQKVLDIMVDNQLHNAKATLNQLMAIKGSKVNAKGVEVQGQLDPDGQRTMAVFKKAWTLPQDEIEQRISEAVNRMGSKDQAVADEAALEYAGLQIALEYVQNIGQSIAEEKDLRDELKQSKEDASEADKATQSYREYVESVEEAIRKNRTERVEGYYHLIGRLSNSLRESIANAAAFREAERQRISQIHHEANSDMEGRPSDEHHTPTFKEKFTNNAFVSFMFSPLATFDQMLRMLGSRSANGEGYLYNRFVRDWLSAREKEKKGVDEKYAILDEKVQQIFGKRNMTFGDLIRMEGKLPKATVSFWNGGKMQERELSQGNLLYIYMVNKMLDGAMKLRKMGISAEDVADIESVLDPRFKMLADWIQEDFLVETRNEYNETHKRMFGASMAAIEDYFPLRILANARADKPEDIDNPRINEGISTTTGSIIKRRRNALALDITGADAFNVLLEHIAQMEHWNAFAEWNRDLNTLRTYRRFRNQILNMTSVYGAGKELWQKFNDVCQIAAGTYRPPRAKLDEAAVNFAKGVTAAKVSFRIFTALKQIFSAPAYIPEVNVFEALKNPAEPFTWCLENLPLFAERWQSRMSGDPRLLKSDMDWKLWRSRIMQLASRVGMAPNAFVDAVTISIGAYSMYKTRKAQYLKDGYSAEKAEIRAKQDATILFNQTQQSSEGAFLSPIQVDRSWLSVLFSVFRNSPMSYQRQLHDAVRNLKRNINPKNYKKTIDFMARQMERDGVTGDPYKSAARKFRRQMLKDTMRVATFGYIMQLAWNLITYLPYLLFGDDDDEKQKMWDDVWAHTMFGWVEGLTGGDVISQAGAMWLTGEGNPAYLGKDMPLSSDILQALQKIGNGQKMEALSDIINLVVQSGVGVNPQSITDGVLAIMDACGDDPELAHEAAICIFRILQVPQSQIDKMYFDEVGLSGEEVSAYTPAELAERYARFKVKRGRFYVPWSWDDPQRIEAQKKKADASIKERLKHLGADSVNESYNEIVEDNKELQTVETAMNKAKKDNNPELAATLAADLMGDKEAFLRYKTFKKLDSTLNKLVDYYMKANDEDEAELCKQTIIDYKKAMVDVLNAESEKEQQSAMEVVTDLMKEFGKEYSNYKSANQ